jgi:hypothetical protein
MVLDKNLYDEINEYCKLNALKTRDFIHKILKEAFLREKYGDSPFIRVQTVKTAEEQACEKIKDLIENQVSVPPDIMECVDEHFFEMLGEQSEETPIIVVKTEEPEPIIQETEEVKPRVKKKRTLK